MLVRVLVGFMALVGLMALWVQNCSGPRPEVESVRVEEPREAGAPYRVEAQVTNHSGGHGEVQVTIRLRDPATSETFQKQERVMLAGEETAHVTVEILAPPGRGYAPEAEAEYPPR